MKYKIVLIGSNPSNKSPDNSAFHSSTRSRGTIDSWFHDIDCNIVFLNVSDEKNENNRPLTKIQIIRNLPRFKKNLESLQCHRIVALGKTAVKALQMLKVEFLEMPHPSGTNRLLNDRDFVEKKVSELKRFINGS